LGHQRARLQQHGANKLLVMIDGRTIYTPLYAGVFGMCRTVMLEDIDRIESSADRVERCGARTP